MVEANLLEVINQIAVERGIDVEEVYKALERALLEAYLREYPGTDVKVELDKNTGNVYFVVRKKVVKEVKDPNKEIDLEEAKRYNPEIKEGTIVEFTHTIGILGRIAAQTAKRVINRVLKDAQLKAIVEYYKDFLGKVVSGKITKVYRDYILVELERGMAIFPKEEQVEKEFYELGKRYKFLVKELINEEFNRKIILSRRDPEFLRALFEMEIPELANNQVKIEKIARIPGERSKVAVRALDPEIDPIGTFVGPRGMRINTIMDELGEERVDIVKWDFDPTEFIKNAFSPAVLKKVEIDEEKGKAVVYVSEEQYPIALGRDGINVKLVSELTGYDIDVKVSKEN